MAEEVSTSGVLGAGSVSGSISDIELSGTAGARSLQNVLLDSFWIKPNNPTSAQYFHGTGAPSYYFSFPSFLVTDGRYDTPDTFQRIPFSGSLGSSSLSLSDSDGFSLVAQLALRDINATSNVSGTSACAIAPFIFFSNQLQFSSGHVYEFEIVLPSGVSASSYNPSHQFGLYNIVSGRPNGNLLGFFTLRSVVISDGMIQLTAYCNSNVSYSASSSNPLYLSLPGSYGVGVTQATFVSKTDEQTNTLMNTDGSSTLVSNIVGQHDSSDMASSLGIGDALQIATGGFTSVMGQTASGVVRFNGLSLGADYGNFEIPAFTVDVWSWCPDSLATVIKTAFTALAVVAWAQGMKRFFDRIFHGELVVSAE